MWPFSQLGPILRPKFQLPAISHGPNPFLFLFKISNWLSPLAVVCVLSLQWWDRTTSLARTWASILSVHLFPIKSRFFRKRILSRRGKNFWMVMEILSSTLFSSFPNPNFQLFKRRFLSLWKREGEGKKKGWGFLKIFRENRENYIKKKEISERNYN